MKQVRSVADQLMEAYKSAEVGSDNGLQHQIKVDENVLDDELSTLKDSNHIEEPIYKEPEIIYQSPEIAFQKPKIIEEPTFTPEPIYVEEPQIIETIPEPDYVTEQIHVEPQTYHQTTIEPDRGLRDFVSTTNNTVVNLVDDKSINQIIKITDLYRSFEQKIQDATKQFVKIDKTENDLSKIVYGIINVKNDEKIGLADLVDLKEQERTARAFGLMSLPDDRLVKVNDLVMLFNDNFIQEKNVLEKVLYCKHLEQAIENLNNSCLLFLKPISEILSIGRE